MAVMARFLSPEWITEIDAAARASAALAEATAEVRLVVQQVVTGTPDGDVRYAIRVDHGKVEVTPGEAPDADVTFTQDWQTAQAMSTGEVGAQQAFMHGHLQVAGDTALLMRHQGAFADLDAAFEEVRARTTYL